MQDVKCPKCGELMQFPFMVCSDCRWKPEGKEIDQHNYYARRYIAEHPDEAPQLKLVLESVMEDKKKEVERSESSSMTRPISQSGKPKVWYVIFLFIFGLLWIPSVIVIIMDPNIFLGIRVFIFGTVFSFMSFITSIYLFFRLIKRKKES